MRFFAAAAAVVSASCVGAAALTEPADSIFLTVAYCPSMLSGKGAVVKVDGATFKTEVVSKFDFPDGIDQACPVNEDANFFSDTVVGTRRTHLSFGSVSRRCLSVGA